MASVTIHKHGDPEAEFSEADRSRTPQQRFLLVEELVRLALSMRGVDDGVRTDIVRVVERGR